jgi:two-component system CheB/CheR fusion protein
MPGPVRKTAFPVKLPLRDLTEQTLLREITPAGVLVNSHGDILYQHGRTGMFLEPAPGEVKINNILAMAREGLRPALSAGLHKTGITREIVRTPGLSVRTNGHFSGVNLSIHPVSTSIGSPPESLLYLVVLEEMPPLDAVQVPDAAADDPVADADARINALKQELRTKEELATINTELQTKVADLSRANNDMNNLLAGTGIGTVFMDHQLRILP